MEQRDVVVVGSGFGGLVAGGLAARAGLRVTVLEAHTRPGGCAGDFALDGFWFPAGATVVTGLEPGGILDRVFRALGRPVAARALDPSIVIHFPGQSLPYVASHSDWLRIFERAFPAAGPGYRRFWNWAHLAGGAVYEIGTHLPSLPLRTLADLRRTVPALAGRGALAVPLLPFTVGQVKAVLGARGCAEADALIDGVLLDATGCTAVDASAVQGAIALDLYRRGCQWVDGGTGRLAMSLVRAIRGSGGEVHFARPVTALRQSGRGWTVEVGGSPAFDARTVVANIPAAAFARLAGSRRPPPVRDRDAWGAFVLHLGIDGEDLEYPGPFHQVIDPAAPVHEAAASALVSIYPGRGVRSARWSLSVSTHTSPAAWQGLDAGSACRRRLQLEDRLIGAAERVIPGVRGRVLVRRSATPLTYERFTGRPGGYVGGLRQRRGVVALLAPDHRPAPGAFLAGDHVFPGQGTVGVALSGINAYRDVADYLGRRPLL